MSQVNKDTIIADAIKLDPEIAQFFLEIGMHCLGCSAAMGETIEEACQVHGVNAEELVNKINDYLGSK